MGGRPGAGLKVTSVDGAAFRARRTTPTARDRPLDDHDAELADLQFELLVDGNVARPPPAPRAADATLALGSHAVSVRAVHQSGKTATTTPVTVVADAPPARTKFTPVTPTRLMDTRSGLGVRKGPVGAGGVVSLPVTGVSGVPATGVTAVVLNVTATGPTAGSFVTVYPDGKARPAVSNLNFTAGETIPNLVVVPVVDGKVDFSTSREASPCRRHHRLLHQ